MAERMSTNCALHQIVVIGLSDRGLQRDNNEDHFMVADLTRKVIGVHENQLRPELFHHDIGTRGTVLIVADGLGGHEGGEVASQMAVDIVAHTLVNTAEQGLPISEQIIRAVDMAHEAICKHHGVSGRSRHMASTLTVVHIGHDVLTIAQVGDSRAYRFSRGQLTLLTDDQTVVHMMQKKGMLTPEEAQNHPHRNIILQALGQDKSILPEIQSLPFSHNDYLLLCSDGLSSYVAHERIEEILSSGEDEHVRCRRLVEAANAAGGADNVTVLLARLIIKGNTLPEALGESSTHRVPHRAAHAPTSIRSTEVSGSRPTQAASSLGNSPPSPMTHHTAPAAPASAPAKVSIWKRELKWPWGQKTASPTGPRTPKPEPAEALSSAQNAGQEEHAPAKPGNATSTASWDPRVLKAVEDSLAEYIGPVAKILVGRAAHHTKDLHTLCQALATHLSTEQERKSFLHNALHQKQTPPDAPR
jgi:serine/threonine protein phosphatase PrpC